LIKVKVRPFGLYVLPIFLYIGHIFIAVGDHPEQLGNQTIEVCGRGETTDGVSLGARFGGFLQRLLKPA